MLHTTSFAAEHGIPICFAVPCRRGFGGKGDVVWVLGGEGQVGAWTRPAQLSSLRQSLDRRGVREAGLMQSLNAANMRSDWELRAHSREMICQGLSCREQLCLVLHLLPLGNVLWLCRAGMKLLLAEFCCVAACHIFLAPVTKWKFVLCVYNDVDQAKLACCCNCALCADGCTGEAHTHAQVMGLMSSSAPP